ncbi:methyl-accepting chemotaxis protein [Ideonella sp.]|uniref:methyl-accepting chemotaxis protein n=1 Tax=Ideonella sp. TaxID=1929293 RepID=UPI003BB7EE9B
MTRTTLSTQSLATRLGAGFAVLLLMMAGLAGYAMLELQTQGARVRQIAEVNNAKASQANALLDSIGSLAIQARSVTLLTDVREIEAEMLLFRAAAERSEAAQKQLTQLAEQTSSLADEATLIEAIASAGKVARPLMVQAAKEGETGANVEATLTLTLRVRPAETAWRQAVKKYIDELDAANLALATATLQGQRNDILLISGVLALALAFGAAMGWRITRSITVPMARAMRVAERIAEGDLSSRLDNQGGDEIGRLLQAMATMQNKLRELVGGIRDSAESIHTASTEVASGNQDLSHRTEQTASNLQQAASAMSELSGTVQQSAGSARQANEMAGSAAQVARRGSQAVSEVVNTMQEINQSSRRIADIIGVIDGIAFQTNILALNAAVEAARAGEQGRGFAVVAGEVRNLASRSAEAAREIKSLIGSSVERVEAGTQLVQAAGGTMDEIVASVARVSAIISDITATSSEQSSGLDSVSMSVTQLDQMTQQNAALVEQSAAAAESLKDQAERLSQLVRVFRTDRHAEAQPG